MQESASSTQTQRSTPFHVMTKPIGPLCNIECEYCFYLDKQSLYSETDDFQMDDSTLTEYIKQYIDAQPGPVVQFAWQGGEPTLLGIDFFERVIELQETHAPPGTQVTNSIQTNGTLLDNEWGRFLAKNDFLVGISIDGPPSIHNQFRTTRGDDTTFDQVRQGLDVLQKHNVEYNVLCVLNSLNSEYPYKVYNFFKDCDVDWIQFIPLVEYVADESPETGPSDAPERSPAPQPQLDSPDQKQQYPWVEAQSDTDTESTHRQTVARTAREAPVTGRSVGPLQYGEFMCTIFDEWVRHDINSISIRLFNQALSKALSDEVSLCVFSETCGEQVAMEHNGDVYACDHYVEPGYKLGNIHHEHLATLVDSEDQQRFGDYKQEGLPEFCQSCSVQHFCHGGCPKNRHLQTPDGDLGLNYLCAGYQRFFSHVETYLPIFQRTVEAGLPLEAVMDEISIRDERAIAD